ncbi:MAG: hypothetical protein A2270_07325 [Elusimicrobia bacterium RIFOXYA12_FULL_51_18]|nr:MAG: hypothetical protein A2270_07325 [Elusimicrobia bacterium RIFOXYA12_FULL_51_18]OGS28493.1 MAG: hypothetical protein A2218_05630 [Elusimicrobia bacterium RIFOXYA2_FULL_53_38]
MKVAVIFEDILDSGGGFQQALSTACLLNKHHDTYTYVFYTTQKQNIEILGRSGAEAHFLNPRSISNLIYRVYDRFFKYGTARRWLQFISFSESPFEKVLINNQVDLIYFLRPSALVLFLAKTNYIITVWDLCHRDHPEFPEVNFEGEFEGRENLLINTLHKAVAVLADSESGKANIIRRYGCDPERIFVAQFLPAIGIRAGQFIDIRKRYSLKNKYIFYPAQFWSHKNHIYILDGLKLLRHKFGVEIDAVFSGSDKGNLQFVLNYARKLGLESNVHYVGFVPTEEMSSFYKHAVALVMPTYFGPTNIPPLEAFTLGCPVCYSDLPGLRDQVRDAVFLMDLDEPESMANHIMTILSAPEIVQEKINRGKQLLSQWTANDYWNVLREIFDKYSMKMRCWKNE